MSLQNLSETFLIIGKIKRDTGENCIDIYAKYLFVSSSWIFPTVFEKFSMLWKSNVDGRTDRRDELNSRFPKFCECA